MIPHVVSRSAVLVFELVQIGPICDTVIAWGAVPLSNYSKSKVALLKGTVDSGLTQMCELQRKIQENLDNWLCNLYFSAEGDFEIETSFGMELMF